MNTIRRVKHTVIGGGMQAMTLVSYLLYSGRLKLEDICIIDPSSSPLAVLAERFKDCWTKHLRSGPFDHVDCEVNSLLNFAQTTGREAELLTDKQRPTVPLFVDHARYVYEKWQLENIWLKAWATGFHRDGGVIQVMTTEGIVETNSLHLCLGQLAPFYPYWAKVLRGKNSRISHIFDSDYELCQIPHRDSIAVIGGGITGAQAAVSLAEKLGVKVNYITRRPINSERGSTSSDYWKERCRRDELCKLPWPARWDMIRKEGDRGTIPPWEVAKIEAHRGAGTIVHEVCDIALCVPDNEHVQVIREDGSVLHVDSIVLATGLQPAMPDWLLNSARRMSLPFDENGRPFLTDTLGWGDGSGVTLHGVYAQPVLGPFAANIAGARSGAEICVECFK